MSLARSIKGSIFSTVAGLDCLVHPQGNTALAGITNFLLLQHPTALGTAIHATPLIPALRHAVPNARIAVVASGLAVEVLRHNPGIEQLIETPSPLRDLRGAVGSLRSQMPFQGEPFATLTSMGNERTRIALQALLSGASNRIGFTEAPPLFRVPLKVDSDRSLIDNNLAIVAALGHPFAHFEPEVFVSPADLTHARQLLALTGAAAGQPVAIFVTQNSGGQRTGWHLDRFIEVIRHASDKLGCAIVYVGTDRDVEPIEVIRREAGGNSLAGKTTIPQLAGVLALADVVVSLDTGTLHLGRAVKVPLVVLGPSWQKPLEWLPLKVANARILRGEDRPSIPENYRLDEIAAPAVIAALEDLLQTYPPRSEHRETRAAAILA